MNKAGYTPVMLAALTAADSSDDLEVAQLLLKLGNVNACSRQVGQLTLAPDLGPGEEQFRSVVSDFDFRRNFICVHPLPSALQ